jgi:hypothetical protein
MALAEMLRISNDVRGMEFLQDILHIVSDHWNTFNFKITAQFIKSKYVYMTFGVRFRYIGAYNQEQKLLRQPHKCMPPLPPIERCVDAWKEKIQPTFSNIDHGGRVEAGRTLNMAKNVKSHYFCTRL